MDVCFHAGHSIIQLVLYLREKRYKVNVEHYDNYTIKFHQKRVWHFVAEMSNGTLNDSVTTLNVPLIVNADFSLCYIRDSPV